MPEEAEEEDEEHDGGVVGSEVGEVAPHAEHRVGVGVRAGEGRRVEKLPPWARSGDEGFGGGGGG